MCTSRQLTSFFFNLAIWVPVHCCDSYWILNVHQPLKLTSVSFAQGHAEALALVNVNQALKPGTEFGQGTTAAAAAGVQDSGNVELERAKELVELHYGVKVKHMTGPGSEPMVDEGLRRARDDVNRVLRELS